jgi:hypothetical protein
MSTVRREIVLGAFSKLRNSTKNFDKSWYLSFLRKFKFHLHPTRITGTFYEDVSTFLAISR